MRETVLFRASFPLFPIIALFVLWPNNAHGYTGLLNGVQWISSLGYNSISLVISSRPMVLVSFSSFTPYLMVVSVFFLLLSIFLMVQLSRQKWSTRMFSKVNGKEHEPMENFEKIIDDLKSSLQNFEGIITQKNSFISNMSLEIRTQMKSIVSFNMMLMDNTLSFEIRKHYIDIIKKRCNTLISVMNNVIHIQHIDTGTLEIMKIPFNLNQLLINIHHRFTQDEQSIKHKHVELKLSIPDDGTAHTIVSDPYIIEQVLTNLLENALKSTPKGCVEFGYGIETNCQIQFFVRDTGFGIPDPERSLIYNKFYRVKRTSKVSDAGNGLGLSVCKGMIELMGGEIWFTSAIGQGTTFYFTVPHVVAKSTLGIDHIGSWSGTTTDLTGKLILVIDDDPNCFQFIEALLSDTNARLIRAKSGEEGVEICSLIDNIDLILIDMQLPFMSGYEAVGMIKDINPHIIVVAQTAFVISDHKSKCLNAGCNDYIPKPIDPDELFRMLNHYLLSAPVS